MRKENIALAHWLLRKRRELKKAKDMPIEPVSESQRAVVCMVFEYINEAISKIESEIEKIN